MNDSLNHIKFAIFDGIKPDYTGEEPLSLDLIEYHVINVRSMLIEQDLTRGYSLNPALTQSLGCIGLEEVDKGCCDVPVNCYILRTNVDLPNPIKLRDRSLIVRVGPVDFTRAPFQEVQYQRVPFTGENRFTRGLVKYFWKDKRIYLIIKNDNPMQWALETIKIDMVAEDPTELSEFNNCDGTNCFTADSPFPIERDMIPTLIEIVKTKFIGPQAIAPIDNSQDNKSNLEQQINN